LLCSEFEAQDKILGPKFDTLKKHGGQRKAKKAIPLLKIKRGQWYIATNCRHLINERRHTTRQVQKPISLLLQEVKDERARKRQQMAVIFHLLQQGQPMLEYEAIFPLLRFLQIPKLPLRHWSDNSGWTMAAHMDR
jgi:hypothetical protein